MKYEKYKDSIDRWIEADKDAMIASLAELIAIPSEAERPHDVRRALDLCVEMGKSCGFESEAILDGQIGIIEAGCGSRTLGILAHVDVVPAREEDGWSSPPYQLTVDRERGLLTGRGAADDKGGIIASLYAMRAVAETGVPFTQKVQLIIGTKEETEWTDMDAYKAHCTPPDYGFTPDGEFPLGNLENGYADVLLSFPKKICGADDPGFLVEEINCGISSNTVPETAHAVIKGPYEKLAACLDAFLLQNPGIRLELLPNDGHAILRASGKASHSSLPQCGENPLWTLAAFLSAAGIAKNGAENVAAFLNEVAKGDFYGEPFGLYVASPAVDGQPSVPTAAAPTTLDTTEGFFCLNYNIRQAHHVTRDDIESGFGSFGRKYGFTFEITQWEDPLHVSRREPFLKAMAEVYQNSTGKQECFTACAGTTYAKALPNMVSFGPLFSGDEDACHSANECLRTDSLIKAAKLYAYYIAEMAL